MIIILIYLLQMLILIYSPNLVGFDLSGVNLENVDLSGVDPTNADLSGANLTGAVLSSVDLSGTNLSNANLFNTNIDNIKNIEKTTGVASNLPYKIKAFKNGIRELTQELVTDLFHHKKQKISGFKEGQTIIVNGIELILGKVYTDAVLVDADPDSSGDSFSLIKQDRTIKGWGHKTGGGKVPSDIKC